ncbi:hypothetical protein CF15_00925 [Pyrodictium occultum]|uniref:NurA domain-containing protein n=1 Tax=Pyrodictium occultum TaxID=2309 RepID=A0A0V8RTQ1_PYROC|nr:DNA double-strand break repair nuclease NurA [Pyrodictium occultum]KSW11451.1 hypothetical protein CF15_00925 [Pyrodictium occultum]
MAWPGGAPGPLPGGPAPEEDEEEIELTPAVQMLLETSRYIAEKIASKILGFREEYTSDEGLSRQLGSLPRGRLGEAQPEPGVAIDSTFPIDGGVELVGGRLIAVVAGYVSFGGLAARGVRRHDVYAQARFVDTEDTQRILPLYAKLVEKAVAHRVLGYVEDGSMNARVILFDGELVPYPLLFKSQKTVARSRLLVRLDEQVARLLERARSLRLTLVGVVKRSYSRLLGARLGRRLSINDKALMSLLLSRGEYLVAGQFQEILPRYAEIVAAEKGLDPGKYRSIVEERLGLRSEYGRVTVAFYKPSLPRPGLQAVRVEVLDYGGLGLKKLLSMLNTLTNPATGLPYPIDLVDEYTRLESRMLELLRRRIISHLAEMLEEVGGTRALVLLSHTNPEKRYVYEPRRRRG